MTTIEDILGEAGKALDNLIKQEISAQGHYLTGALDESLDHSVSKEGKVSAVEGTAAHYIQYVNDGFPAGSASFRQFPFLVEYFIKRGYPEFAAKGQLTARQLAAMTINKWMKEGMPTQASKAYSQTGSRTNAIENTFTGHENTIDEIVENGMDFVVEERFQKEKSEVI